MNNEKKKVALHNLGCKVNAYETDAMTQKLRENGFEIVPFDQGADIYIINTCTVTNIADRKSRQMLHKAKKMNPDAVVIAVGCYVQAAGEELLRDEAIDIIVGNNKKGMIVQIIDEYFIKKENNAYLEDLSRGGEYDDMFMTTLTEHTRAFIKIQDGCNQFCTYCIIPYARGRIRSREPKSIISEVERLAGNGYKEIVLTGIHLSSYGKDFNEGEIGLIDIIEAVNDIEGVERIRLGSLEQGIITEDFMKRISRVKKFCPHFHLSLQSGSKGVLKRMNRHYTPDEYLEKCNIIRKYFESPALTTDVIVGFPGETEEEFSQTEEFLEKVAFAEMHIFKYSMRKGTVAAGMENQVDDRIKSQRSDKLLELDEKLKNNFRSMLIGKERDILFEEKISINGEEYFVGHTKEYVKVAVKTRNDVSNQILKVNITQMLNKEILLAQLS